MSVSFHPVVDSTTGEVSDELLVARAQAGDWDALEQILSRHQDWIFTLALRMVGTREDAEDVTQEVLLKIITKLSTFAGKSRFRTWLYRIVINHVLNLKQRPKEMPFSLLGQRIDTLPEQEERNMVSIHPSSALIAETKIQWTTGMLLCLDRRQRLVYVLGEILGVTSEVGAELVEVTPANFRQLLARARRDLGQFMQQHCSLLHPANPCHCARKTRAFIAQGRVDPQQRQFTDDTLDAIAILAPTRAADLHTFLEDHHLYIYREPAFVESPPHLQAIRHLLHQPEGRTALSLDE